MFDAAYQELEKCLTEYIKRKNGGGWTEKVMAFQKDKLPYIQSQRNIPYLINETNQLADSLRSAFDWMPCAAGSVLQIELKCFLLRVEREYKNNLPRRHSAPPLLSSEASQPISIPMSRKSFSCPMLTPSPEASPFIKIEIQINSQPYRPMG